MIHLMLCGARIGNSEAHAPVAFLEVTGQDTGQRHFFREENNTADADGFIPLLRQARYDIRGVEQPGVGMGWFSGVFGMKQPGVPGFIGGGWCGQKSAKKSMMRRIGEAPRCMPFFPMPAAAQVRTIALLQHRRIITEGIQGNHEDVVIAYNPVHICHIAVPPAAPGARQRSFQELKSGSCFISQA
ncbi:hypothetical protein D3C75_877170 [compost metagenome]